MRLIDADALRKRIKAKNASNAMMKAMRKECVAEIDDAPTIEPEPKKGKWTRPFPTRPKTYERFCSECKGKAWYCGTGDYNFCPNCGADMREGDMDG